MPPASAMSDVIRAGSHCTSTLDLRVPLPGASQLEYAACFRNPIALGEEIPSESPSDWPVPLDEATVDALGEHNLSEFPSDLTFSEPCSERDLEDYLRSLEDEGFIPSSMRRSALKLWKTLEHLSGHCLTIPGAAPGPDGKLFLVWGEGEHHFEAELIPDNPIEFFYMNRGTNETWSGEAADENEVSHEIVEKLMSLWG